MKASTYFLSKATAAKIGIDAYYVELEEEE